MKYEKNFGFLFSALTLLVLFSLISSCSSKHTATTPDGIPTVTTKTGLNGSTIITVDGMCSLTPAAVLTPCGIAVNSTGVIYMADIGHNRIIWCDPSGNTIGIVGGPDMSDYGTGDYEFHSPFGVALDGSDNIYVLDSYNERIQKYNSSFSFLTRWGSLGSGNGQFDHPLGIAVDKLGNVYVADTQNNRIQKFNSGGSFLTSWGSSGTGNGQFDFPTSLAVDANGTYIKEISTVVGYSYKYPWAITTDSTGSAYAVFFVQQPLVKYLFK